MVVIVIDENGNRHPVKGTNFELCDKEVIVKFGAEVIAVFQRDKIVGFMVEK